MDIAELGVRVTDRGVVQTATRLERFQRSGARAERQAVATGRAVATMSRGFRSFDSRNVALQLSQVAQQASATGDVMPAFAIQLPDLAIGFGTFGILAGAAAGALLPLVTNLMSARTEAEDFESTIPQLERALSSLQEAEALYARAIADRALVQNDATRNALLLAQKELDARKEIFELQRIETEIQAGQLRERIAEQTQLLDELTRVRAGLTEDVSNESFVNTQAEQERLRLTMEALDANQELVNEIRLQNAELDIMEVSLARMDKALEEAFDTISAR
ncbi:hypothetical protein AADZ90_017060 [Aestuariibius sp. 2305UL40-4]|uniref:hypothetical protein n=1 Tax=Aestuariibius violaceus TaxID=3234132 RepID=UPI00345E91C5